ncbi:MAG: GDSL family lipase [Pedobacter sp.]|nr:MAG: GDSL family lipase [Pedobacter sp.]
MARKINQIVRMTCLLLILGTATNGQVPVDSTYINTHYTLRLDFFKKMPDQKKEIVFLGNSLTEGGKWQELINKKNVINRGISGDVTYGILARLDEVTKAKPAKIFLLCGINDMKRGISNELILDNFRRIVSAIKSASPKTTLYIQSLLPVYETVLPASYSQISNQKINDLNGKLRTLCRAQNVVYVDLHPAFADEQGSMKKELAIDGLHLRQASYILWAKRLKETGAFK